MGKSGSMLFEKTDVLRILGNVQLRNMVWVTGYEENKILVPSLCKGHFHAKIEFNLLRPTN